MILLKTHCDPQKILSRQYDIVCFYFLGVNSPQCQSGNLPHGVKIIDSCSFRIQDSCKVVCRQKGVTKWKTHVHCLEHGKWSPLPHCKRKFHARSLEPVDCQKLPVKIRGKAFCVKVNLNKASYVCPELLYMKIDLADCSQQTNNYCVISCGDIHAKFTCFPSGHWSSLTPCTSSGRSACPDAELGTLTNCSRRGEICKVNSSF